MQSDSDSDNEFFDAPEKLSLSGSFASDSRCVLIFFFLTSKLVRKSFVRAYFGINVFILSLIDVVIPFVALPKFQPGIRISC